MESNNKIDKIFRDALKNNAPQPPDSIRQAVFAALDHKEKDKPFLGWRTGLVAILVLSTLSTGIWWMNSGEANSISAQNNQAAVIETIPSAEKNSSDATIVKPENAQVTSTVKTIAEKSAAASIQSSDSKSSAVKTTKQNAFVNHSKQSNSNSVAPNRNLNGIEKFDGVFYKEYVSKETTANNSFSNSDNGSHLLSTSANQKQEESESKSSPKPEEKNGLNSVSEPVTTNAPLESANSAGENIEKKKSDSQISAFAIEVNGGPSFFTSKIGQNKTGNQEFTTMVENAESQMISANAGIEFSIQMKNKVFFQTGLNYDWINESFKYQSPAAGPLPAIDYNEVNKYEYLSIPVLLGMNFEVGKFSFKPQGGVSLMMLTKASGYTIDFDSKNVVNFDQSSLPFNNSILTVMFRANVQYQASNNIGISLQPGVRINTRSVYSTDYAIGKELTRFTVNAGFQYKF